ncbi:MAG: hypothetical protein A2Y73_06735 [Chloroflexi bacterium RBG_13_56_8]|nr:MAG: hypothetical protein A2Y73_06735 [Chloroflexi bacterium RBG_13_56_8]
MGEIAVIKGGRLVNVFTREILPWDVVIKGGRILCIGPDAGVVAGTDAQTINAEGRYLVPGLISAHDHYEMTLMSAVPFAEAVLPSGTTAAILDPHDMVNVMGMEGLRLLIDESRGTPLKAFFVVPPCVPPSPALEDAGCDVRLEDVQEGLRYPGVIGIAEAMDFARIIQREPEMMRILDWARSEQLMVDGHCPEVRGSELCRYVAAGPIRTDHESVTVEEQIEKLRLGMYVILRRGSLAEPISAGDLVAQVYDTSNLLLSTDGCIAAEDVLEHGHMSWAVQQIIAEGVDPLTAIQMATINVARCYGLDHRIGLIAPGRAADILFVDDLTHFRISQVMVDGRFIEAPLSYPRYSYPEKVLQTVHLDPVSSQDLVIHAPESHRSEKIRVRVMEIVDGTLLAEERIEKLPVNGVVVEVDPSRDILKAAVFERYGKGTRALGFIRGFDLTQGALAGSIGQDSQNVVGVGVSDEDLALAINRVRELNGGVVVAAQGHILAELPLPIAGIMTDISPRDLVAARAKITATLRELGCQLHDPIFTLSLCITLVVIPYLKMSNRGLVDVLSGRFVSLFVS